MVAIVASKNGAGNVPLASLLAMLALVSPGNPYGFSLDGACTNWAESFFARLRRGEIGHSHHIAGPYLLRYAQEAAWKEDNRRNSNGQQVTRVVDLALSKRTSPDFVGYWQRHTTQKDV